MHELYTFTVPIFIKVLGGVKRVLKKGEEFAVEKKFDPTVLLQSRLAPDMFALTRQVQMACDNAKGVTARLAGIEIPKYEDNEQTLAELYARIDKTVAFVKSVAPEAFDGAAERKIVLPYFPGKYLTGFDYAREYALPNFFFHVAMTYAILRNNGVPIGKADYIDGLPLKEV